MQVNIDFLKGFLLGLLQFNSYFFFETRKSKYKDKVYVNIYPFFIVTVKVDKMDAVFKLKNYYGFGTINFVKSNNTVQYRLTNKDECLEVVNEFGSKLVGWRKEKIKLFKKILLLLKEEKNVDIIMKEIEKFKKWKYKVNEEKLRKKFHRLCKKYGYSALY